MQWEESSVASAIFLTKVHYSCPNLIKRKPQVQPKLRGICTCWDASLQKCQGHKNQGKNEELLQADDAQWDMTAGAHVILNRTLLLWKWCYGDSWQTLNGAWGLDGSNALMLTFTRIVLCMYEDVPLVCGECILKFSGHQVYNLLSNGPGTKMLFVLYLQLFLSLSLFF